MPKSKRSKVKKLSKKKAAKVTGGFNLKKAARITLKTYAGAGKGFVKGIKKGYDL